MIMMTEMKTVQNNIQKWEACVFTVSCGYGKRDIY